MIDNKTGVKFLLIWSAIAVFADSILSIEGITAIVQPKNLISDLIVISITFVVNGIIASTNIIFGRSSNILFVFIWLMAAFIDIYTTFIAVLFGVVLGDSPSDFPTISIRVIIDSIVNNIMASIFIFLGAFLISLLAASSGFLLAKHNRNG